MENQGQAGTAASRRRLLMLLGAGGVLGAAATVGGGAAAGSGGPRTVLVDDPDKTEYIGQGLGVILAVPDAGEAVGFYQVAFGGQTLLAARDREGRIFHAQLLVNGLLLAVSSEDPEIGFTAPKPGDQSTMWLTQFVPDLDATVERAVGAGATMLQPPVQESELLMRACLVAPSGHTWQVFQTVRPFTVAELQQVLEEKQLGL